ncbi:MAG: GNAT family N-acetyltransferase [Chloroflexaceae bacterium]|nr:GNAT family N-acetyltransferase [Chloroflexaceae bacterium]
MVTRSFIRVETPRLILRHFALDDLPALVAYRNDPEVAYFQGWDSITAEQCRLLIEEMSTAQPMQPGTWFQLAVALRDSDTVIGDFGLHADATDPQQVEVGFTLARTYWGRGLAREALLHLFAHLFAVMQTRRIIAITDVLNSRSVALLERVGMRREGHFCRASG